MTMIFVMVIAQDFGFTFLFVKEDGDGVSFVILMVFLGHTLRCMPEFSCS